MTFTVGDHFYTKQDELHEVAAVQGNLFFAVPVRETTNGQIIKDYSRIKTYSLDPAGSYYPIEQTITNRIQ